MKVVVGGDHAGYELKQKVLAYLEEQGHEVIHVGSYTPEMVDFPDIAAKVCRSILDGEAERAQAISLMQCVLVTPVPANGMTPMAVRPIPKSMV